MDHVQQDAKTPVWPLILFGCAVLVFIAFSASSLLSGDLLGSDDMMRMQQVRDLITGQNGWYNVNQSRLLTPEGGAMHWSRVPDLFLAGVVWMGQPIVGRAMAEAIAIALWPALQMVAMFAAMAVCLRRLGAPLSGQIAALFFLSTSFAMMNFVPGRVDHHGLGLIFTVTALACLLNPRLSIRSGLIAAICVAAMLTVAVENLPAAALTIAGFGAAWIFRGGVEAPRLRAFGASLIVAGLINYVFDAPGAGGIRNVCDAFGQSHFVALLVAGTGLATIGTVMPDISDWKVRAATMATAGVVTAISFMVVNPDCLGDPYSRLSGDVQSGWLSVVSEARSITSVMKNEPAGGLYYYGFPLAGVVAGCISLLMAGKGERFSRGAVLVLCVAGLALATWQLRGAGLAHTAASIPAGWMVGYLVSDWLKNRGGQKALVLFVGVALLSPGVWNMPNTLQTGPASEEDEVDCRSAAAFQSIAAAPRMIVFTPIDLGAPLIYHTRHYASAAPYHRNPSSIEMTLSVFGGATETAREKIGMTGATHLLYCPGLSELETYAKRSPDGFAADLEAGNLPGWLTLLTEPPEGEKGPVIYTIDFGRN